MPRLLFEKRGNSIWISHLDLMRLFQRAFKRAGLPLKHTQGFNPRPSVSIALPLSVGIESSCELLDFALDGESVSEQEIKERLNRSLIAGVRVLDVYDTGRKIRDLALLDCEIILEYDAGIPEDAAKRITRLLTQDSLLMEKKNRNGVTEQDLIPMIRRFSIAAADSQALIIRAIICCQNPTLNPMQIPAAITKYLPDLTPDFTKCRRIEIFDGDETIFR